MSAPDTSTAAVVALAIRHGLNGREETDDTLRALAAERDAAVSKAKTFEVFVAARGTNRDYWEACAKETEAERDAARAEVEALREAISWVMGEGDSDFGDNIPHNPPRFWWRSELQRRTPLKGPPA